MPWAYELVSMEKDAWEGTGLPSSSETLTQRFGGNSLIFILEKTDFLRIRM